MCECVKAINWYQLSCGNSWEVAGIESIHLFIVFTVHISLFGSRGIANKSISMARRDEHNLAGFFQDFFKDFSRIFEGFLRDF